MSSRLYIATLASELLSNNMSDIMEIQNDDKWEDYKLPPQWYSLERLSSLHPSLRALRRVMWKAFGQVMVHFCQWSRSKDLHLWAVGPILLNYLLAVSKKTKKKKKTSSTAGVLMKTSLNTPDRRQNQVSQTFFSSYKGQIFCIFVILTYKRIQLEANTSLIISGISL